MEWMEAKVENWFRTAVSAISKKYRWRKTTQTGPESQESSCGYRLLRSKAKEPVGLNWLDRLVRGSYGRT
jgi:hypothetical protein